MTKKPVPKRRGYAEGGKIDLAEGSRALRQSQDLLKKAVNTDGPQGRADMQRSQIGRDSGMRALNLPQNAVYPADNPEGYPPPNAKGGKVKKVLSVRKKR
jgi:hypothetical protein